MLREIREEISGHVRILMTSRIQTVLLDRVLKDFLFHEKRRPERTTPAGYAALIIPSD
ncbi:MAG TPA: hypothetical protein VK943_14560 [Arenibaculum sp.]|nr:hypothetical protein [Arenibaculum sp.]